MAAIDQEIANEKIASLRATGQEQLALAEELNQKIAEIETNGGTIDQQQPLIDFAREKAMRDAGKVGDDKRRRPQEAAGRRRSSRPRTSPRRPTTSA